MWKKTSMVLAMSALVLVGCNNGDDDVPPADETPMEDVRDEGEDMGNDVEDAGEEMENDLEDAGDELLPDEDTTTENGTEGTYDNGTNDTNGTGNGNDTEEILEDDMRDTDENK